MSNHFFLQGDIQQGKSTLIRSVISSHLQDIGGFSCQRLYDSNGIKKGFRVVPSLEALELCKIYDQNDSGIFIRFEEGKTIIKTEIFVTIVLECLKNIENKKLVLMDEIGGVELMSQELRLAIYQALQEKPCIGVIKQELDLYRMYLRGSVEKSCLRYYRELEERVFPEGEEKHVFRRSERHRLKEDMVIFLRKFI